MVRRGGAGSSSKQAVMYVCMSVCMYTCLEVPRVLLVAAVVLETVGAALQQQQRGLGTVARARLLQPVDVPAVWEDNVVVGGGGG